jgi:branched-chain amino acid transport system ATP-binding protein
VAALILEVKDMTVKYGGARAVEAVSLSVDAGEVVAILGPNGAGKSTVLRAIAGILPFFDGTIERGNIRFRGESIIGLPTHQLVRRGLCLVPEGRHIFSSMTVLENLQVVPSSKPRKQGPSSKSTSVLGNFPELNRRAHQGAGTMSVGEQQLLAIARSLACSPTLLLLDEPSLGLSPNYTRTVFEHLNRLRGTGTTILLVEQNAPLALRFSDRAYVFGIGTIQLEGRSSDLAKDTKLCKLLLMGS